jgi:hypothetical protein
MRVIDWQWDGVPLLGWVVCVSELVVWWWVEGCLGVPALDAGMWLMSVTYQWMCMQVRT